MTRRRADIENQIRDSQIHKLEIQFENYVDSLISENSIKISFLTNDLEVIELSLVNPKSLAMYDDQINGHYITHIKVLENEESFQVCLDPYDERIKEIQEQDNFVFKSQKIKISKFPL